MDTGKASGDNGKTTKMSGFQSSVFSRTALTVVPVANDDPLNALLLVITSSSWYGIRFASSEVLDFVLVFVSGVRSVGLVSVDSLPRRWQH